MFIPFFLYKLYVGVRSAIFDGYRKNRDILRYERIRLYLI